MLRRISLVFLVALLAVSCDENPAQPEATVTTADALFSSQADNPIVHRLTVGGADAEFYGPPGSDANFSLIAIQRADEPPGVSGVISMEALACTPRSTASTWTGIRLG